MKFLILALTVAVAAADVSHILPQGSNTDKDAQILKLEQNLEPDGAYQWEYETSNGIAAGAIGQQKSLEPEVSANEVQGQAAWTSPEGEKVELAYIANENGYQPQGSHIPTPHPIPEYILRALQYIKDHPPQIVPEGKLIK